jgi:hypothetical protein
MNSTKIAFSKQFDAYFFIKFNVQNISKYNFFLLVKLIIASKFK